MMSFRFISILLVSGAAVLASPMSTSWNKSISARQALKIPKNYLYVVEWYPDGCGKGGGVTLNGYEELLGVCSKPNGVTALGEKPTAKGIRFLFPDDGKVYKWSVYASESCQFKAGDDMRSNYNSVVMSGNGTQCVDAPKDQVLINPGAEEQLELKKTVRFGAVLVYT